MRKIVTIIFAAMLCLPLFGQNSRSRYDREFVFVGRMRNLSLGASPTIARSFMPHEHNGARVSVDMPPVHLMAESCFRDFGKGGSLGCGLFLSHARYTYSYAGEDGRGGDRVNVRTGMTDILAGVSYHYTIRTSLEAYTRLMFGFVAGGYKSSSEGATHDMNAKTVWNGVAGLRYYFSNSFGIYAEGGHTSGCVDAGITMRW